jgi:hypothetical protein
MTPADTKDASRRPAPGRYHADLIQIRDLPVATPEMPKGFTPYMVKAILNGRADEIVNLAETNLRR